MAILRDLTQYDMKKDTICNRKKCETAILYVCEKREFDYNIQKTHR